MQGKRKLSRWSPEEKERLKEAVKLYGLGNSWNQIAAYVQTRNNNQCHQHWHRVLSPTLNKSPWTPEEYRTLAERVQVFGENNWTQVAEGLPGRTDISCRQKWITINGKIDKLPPRVPEKLPSTESLAFALLNLSHKSDEEHASTESTRSSKEYNHLAPAAVPPSKSSRGKKRRRSRQILEDSDEELMELGPQLPQQRRESLVPEAEEVTQIRGFSTPYALRQKKAHNYAVDNDDDEGLETSPTDADADFNSSEAFEKQDETDQEEHDEEISEREAGSTEQEEDDEEQQHNKTAQRQMVVDHKASILDAIGKGKRSKRNGTTIDEIAINTPAPTTTSSTSTPTTSSPQYKKPKKPKFEFSHMRDHINTDTSDNNSNNNTMLYENTIHTDNYHQYDQYDNDQPTTTSTTTMVTPSEFYQ